MMSKLHVLLGVLVVTTTAAAVVTRHVRKTLPSEKEDYSFTDSRKDQTNNHVTVATPTVSTYSIYDHRRYMDSDSLARESKESKVIDAYTFNYDDELTTPKSYVFDHRHEKFMEKINQDLEERDVIDSSYEASSAEDKKVIHESIPNNITRDVSLDYSQKVSVVYNKSDTPNSVHGDLIIDNGTHIDFESISIQTKVDPEVNKTVIYPLDNGVSIKPELTDSRSVNHTAASPYVKNNEIIVEDSTIAIRHVNGNLGVAKARLNDSHFDSSNITESRHENKTLTVLPDVQSTISTLLPVTLGNPKKSDNVTTITTTEKLKTSFKVINTTEKVEETTTPKTISTRTNRGRMISSKIKNTATKTLILRQLDSFNATTPDDTVDAIAPVTTEIPEHNTVYPLKPIRTTVRPTKLQNTTTSRRIFTIRQPTSTLKIISTSSTPISDNLSSNKTIDPLRKDNSIDKDSSENSSENSTVKPSTVNDEEGNEVSRVYTPVDKNSRGTVKFGGLNATSLNNTIDSLPIPYSASAWALTTLKEPSTVRKRTQSTRITSETNRTSPATEQQAEPTFIRLATLEQPGREKTTDLASNKATSRTRFTSLSSAKLQTISDDETDSAVGDTSLNQIFAFPSTLAPSSKINEHQIINDPVLLPTNKSSFSFVTITTTEAVTAVTEEEKEEELYTTISSTDYVTILPFSVDTLPSVYNHTAFSEIVEHNDTVSSTTESSTQQTDNEEETISTTLIPSDMTKSSVSDLYSETLLSESSTIGPLSSTVEYLQSVSDDINVNTSISKLTENEYLQNTSAFTIETTTDINIEKVTTSNSINTTNSDDNISEIVNTLPPGTVAPSEAETVTKKIENIATTQTAVESSTVIIQVPDSDNTLQPVQVPAYLRLVVQSSFYNICETANTFKESVAKSLSSLAHVEVTKSQILLLNIGRNQCVDAISNVNETSNLDFNPVQLYIVESDGNFSTRLCDLYYKSWEQFSTTSPFKIQKVEFIHLDLIDPPDNMTIDENDNEKEESTKTGVIVGIVISCVGGICLLLLAILLVVMKKRQKKFNYGQRCTPVSLDAYSLDSVSVYNSVRRKGVVRGSKRSYGNAAFDDPGAPSHSINFAGLANFCSDSDALEEEFNMIPQVTPKTDELPEGSEAKNRYSNVIPLPETRVHLSAIEGDSLSDYINANYVRGPKGAQKFYIACQAPLQSTITDFWRMVWEHQSKIILMLTDLVENDKEKCADYLPPSEVTDCHRLFGDYQVTLKKREVKEKYIISTLQLKNLETNSWREVIHLWYIGWPANGAPEETNSIIAFLIEARAYTKGSKGPTIVHCSPGTGRTGTVLACDLCIREFEQTRMVDIPRCVYRLRRDRAGAVQTKEQYTFIYQVLNLYATKLTGGALDSI